MRHLYHLPKTQGTFPKNMEDHENQSIETNIKFCVLYLTWLSQSWTYNSCNCLQKICTEKGETTEIMKERRKEIKTEEWGSEDWKGNAVLWEKFKFDFQSILNFVCTTNANISYDPWDGHCYVSSPAGNTSLRWTLWWSILLFLFSQLL